MSIPEAFHQSLQPGPACPPVEQLAAYADGVLADPEQARLARHCADCPACAAELSLYRQFAAAQVRPEEAADVAWMAERLRPAPVPAVERPRRAWWMLPAPVWALAGVALVASGLGWQAFRGSMPPVALEEGSSALRSASVELLTPAGDLAEAPAEITWKPVDGAVDYEVKVLAVDGVPLASQRTTEPRWAAQPLRQLMQPRRTLLVRVTAFGADGKPWAASADVQFRKTK